MRLIDEQSTACPFYGSRRMTEWLTRQGEEVNRKRVQRLMRVMGLEAIYPKPRLSAAGRGHKIYPYLLRGVKIERPDQVWSADITYVPMPSGFMYLAAVIDWCRKNRHLKADEQHKHLCQMVRGHYAYYGVTGNDWRLKWFANQVV